MIITESKGFFNTSIQEGNNSNSNSNSNSSGLFNLENLKHKCFYNDKKGNM